MAAHCTYHLPTTIFYVLNKSHTKKALTKNVGESSGKKSDDRTERARGLGKKRGDKKGGK